MSREDRLQARPSNGTPLSFLRNSQGSTVKPPVHRSGHRRALGTWPHMESGEVPQRKKPLPWPNGASSCAGMNTTERTGFLMPCLRRSDAIKGEQLSGQVPITAAVDRLVAVDPGPLPSRCCLRQGNGSFRHWPDRGGNSGSNGSSSAA